MWIINEFFALFARMVIRVKVEEFLRLADSAKVLDVRSPSEYVQGHIPGAISFPLFSDHERAEIGTLYKQVGQDKAIERGLELVQPKMKELYEEGVRHAEKNTLLVHCWRGGKRSESVGWLLAVSGVKVFVLEGGYKAFRQWVLNQFSGKFHPKVIGGMTGSGKTEVLQELRRRGHPVLDLEELAGHRGSAFGALGTKGIPSPAQFENELAVQLAKLAQTPFWVEDESRNIGKISIPGPFWETLQGAPHYILDIPAEIRIVRILNDYGNFPLQDLRESIEKIGRNLGGQRLKEILMALENETKETVISLLLDYYDKAYYHSVKRKPSLKEKALPFEKFDLNLICDTLVAQA